MLITTRYLLKNLVTATAFIALTLTMVIWLTQSLKILELVANSDAPPWYFVKLVTLTIPRFLEIILPLSLVASVLFLYNKMIMDNELVVLRACGFDQLSLARPALLVAGGVTALLLFFTTWLSPYCYAQMHVLKQDIKSRYSAFLLQDGVFNTFGDDMTVYLRARDPEKGDLLGIVIHDARDKDKPPVTVTAKRGRIQTDAEVPSILVYDGMRQQFDETTGTVSKLYFSRYAIEVSAAASAEPARWREPSERTIKELLNPDLSVKRERANQKQFLAEAHHRLTAPFNAIGFTLIALCALLLGPFNRRGQARKIALAAGLVVVSQSLNLLINNVDKQHPEAFPLLYLLVLGPIPLCLYLLGGKGEMRLMALLRRRHTQEAAA